MSPKQLSETPAEIVRQLVVDNWGNPDVPNGGFNANQTDPTADDFLPITTNWAGFGDTFPIISFTNTDPTVPGGGETGVSGIQGNGSGPNQRRLETLTVTVMAERGEDYPNGEDAHALVRTLYEHVFQIVWNNQHAENHPEVSRFNVQPGTHTSEGDDSTTVEQYSGEVTVDWLKTP